MDDDKGLELDVLMAALRIDSKEAGAMMELLAQRLQGALPDNVTVTRGGWILSKDKPVQEILVRFEDFHYQLSRDKHGPLAAKQMKVVRGVALKTNEMTYDEWIAAVARELGALAQQNAQARAAISKLV